jgi:nicotinate dehydrogenase subunit B
MTVASLGLSRRQFLRGSGLAIGVSIGGINRALAISSGPVPGLVPGPVPALNVVDTWLAMSGDGVLTVFTGRSELGQGSETALIQLVAEELDLKVNEIVIGTVESGRAPETGETDGSSSIEIAGPMLRQAAAELRQELLRLAEAKLGAKAKDLRIADGKVAVIGKPDHWASYGDLVGGQRMREIPFTGKAPLKQASNFNVVGRPVPRRNVAEKVSGRFTYMQSHSVPGMLHGRVVRPRGQGPYGRVANVVSVDEASIAHIPAARIVRKSNFVGVVAEKEWDAVKAAQALRVRWSETPGLPGNENVQQALRAAPAESSSVLEEGDFDDAIRRSPFVVQAAFDGPYQAHAPFAPHCAIADVRSDRAEISCSTQGIYVTRMEVANVTGLPLDRITVRHLEGAGTYGPSCYHDVAQSAAIMSQIVGGPVRVQFMRWDEFGWDPYGVAHTADVHVAADKNGKLTGYRYDGWHHGWIGKEMSEEMALGTPAPLSGSGIARIVNKVNAGGMYAIPHRRLVNHHVDARQGFLRGNPLRAPLDLAISFASEQAIDEVAGLAGLDPVEFRRRNIADPRWRGVLDAVVQASGWEQRKQVPRNDARPDVMAGWGVGLGTHLVSYGAAVARVEVNRSSGQVRVLHLFGALDAGLVINPGLVESQIMGMMVQATSRLLKEEVKFNGSNVTSLDWESYPVLRFDECPAITAIVVQRIDQPSTGAGEEVMGASAAAIANAIADALGVRVRRFPITPVRIMAALG